MATLAKSAVCVAEQIPDEYSVTVKVKQSVKYELERIQDEIKRAEKLTSRPPLSDVIDRLIRAQPPA